MNQQNIDCGHLSGAFGVAINELLMVDATNGNISAKYEYGPFGEVFCSVGDMAKVNPFGFSTKYTDNETDLLYYGYRYYSPALGRWLSRDPIEERGGLNLYAFVNNDPVNKWDKLGNIDYFMMQHPGRITSSNIADMIGDPNGDLYNNPIDYYQAWRRGLTAHSPRIYYPDSKMTQSMMKSPGVKSEREKMLSVIRSILCEAGDRVSISDREFSYEWSKPFYIGMKNVIFTWDMTQQFVGSYHGKVGFQGTRKKESCCCTIQGLLSFELKNTTGLESYGRIWEFLGFSPQKDVYEGPFANSTQIYQWTENIFESNCIDLYNIKNIITVQRNSIPKMVSY
ncbi:MAG: RHS repeat-associated core domain-containing protein [Paludibacter sp.]|nr:RHS repeat-associated core domain-containing protein [Paludibacter sp.]